MPHQMAFVGSLKRPCRRWEFLFAKWMPLVTTGTRKEK